MRQHTKRRLIKLFVTAAFFYVFFRAKYYSAHFDTLVAENPHQVWEFVSDLSNAKKLNPSMYIFDSFKNRFEIKVISFLSTDMTLTFCMTMATTVTGSMVPSSTRPCPSSRCSPTPTMPISC